MKYKEYSQDIWNHIFHTLDQVQTKDPKPIAAFDADGTLWDIDLGETFFHYQIKNHLVNLPSDPWDYYQATKEKDPRKAYLWLAQICQGQKLTDVQCWASNAIKLANPIPVFSQQKKLIDIFLNRGIQVYIITASVKWAVEPGAELLGLSFDNVIGVETKTVKGIITDEQNGIITYRQGKVDALLNHTGGKRPFFASGNTMGDFQLLQSASHISLAVSAANNKSKLYKTEHELLEQAQLNGWLAHRFL